VKNVSWRLSEKRTAIRRLFVGRILLVVVTILSFTLQSYVTQTHIHGTSQGFDIDAIAKIVAANSPAHSKSPLDDGDADCPFCQAVAHAGAFFTPITPILILPFIWVKTVAITIITRVVASTTAHNWQSRAPPRY